MTNSHHSLLDEAQAEARVIQVAIEMLTQGASIRAASDATGLSRRQVTKLRGSFNSMDKETFMQDAEARISQKQAVAQVFSMSIRPEGVKRSELHSTLKARYGLRRDEITGSIELDMTKHQYRYLKESALALREAEDTPLFVPEWMPRYGALNAHNALIKAAIELQEVMTEKVLELCDGFSGSSYKMVFQELINLAVSGVSSCPVESRCDLNLKSAEELDRRVGRMTGHPAEPTAAFDPELDSLCV
ncbi:MAG: hypothetical protein PGN19_05140 [Pseudomonas oryzihabitans]